MPETILVTVKSVTNSTKAAPRSRMRISKTLYDEEMALSKQQKREPKYFAEPDQACEGRTIKESTEANVDYIADREKRRKAVAEGKLAVV